MEPFVVKIRAARESERASLGDLALRSKAHWDYSQDFLDACRDELSVPALHDPDSRVFVAEHDASHVVGFYRLARSSPQQAELTHCFVEPSRIGRGVGRLLVAHAAGEARRLGYAGLIIQSDPNAAPFYRALGARDTGTRPSDSIPGRSLPLLVLDLR